MRQGARHMSRLHDIKTGKKKKHSCEELGDMVLFGIKHYHSKFFGNQRKRRNK